MVKMSLSNKRCFCAGYEEAAGTDKKSQKDPEEELLLEYNCEPLDRPFSIPSHVYDCDLMVKHCPSQQCLGHRWGTRAKRACYLKSNLWSHMRRRRSVHQKWLVNYHALLDSLSSAWFDKLKFWSTYSIHLTWQSMSLQPVIMVVEHVLSAVGEGVKFWLAPFETSDTSILSKNDIPALLVDCRTWLAQRFPGCGKILLRISLGMKEVILLITIEKRPKVAYIGLTLHCCLWSHLKNNNWSLFIRCLQLLNQLMLFTEALIGVKMYGRKVEITLDVAHISQYHHSWGPLPWRSEAEQNWSRTKWVLIHTYSVFLHSKVWQFWL